MSLLKQSQREEATAVLGESLQSCGALVWSSDKASGWSASLGSLAAVKDLRSVTLAGIDKKARATAPACGNIVVRFESSFARAIAAAFDAGIEYLLVFTAPVLAPPGILDHSLRWMREDPRLAAVSFLTSGPGFLSFPKRNGDTAQHMFRESASSLTNKIRKAVPHPGRVHIAIPEGGVVLISRAAFSANSGFRREFDDDPELSVAEFSLRASRRGFFTCLDAYTFVLHPVDADEGRSFAQDSGRRHRLNSEHPFFPALFDHQRDSTDGPLALALDYARASSDGLRILIDGSCLGPLEMGTQTQTVWLVNALANHPQVQWVGVALPGATIPSYAESLLTNSKVRLYPSAGLTFSGAEQADILHRPFQPDEAHFITEWRQFAKRIVITILDLIAYRIGPYHSDPQNWLHYRHNLACALRLADGTVVLSHDVEQSLAEEKFDIPAERLLVAESGTDHLTPDSEEQIPLAVLERGWASSLFALVLGTDYNHKNRDLAIRVWRNLRDRGYPLRLLIAGASIPYGSSRHQEALAGNVDDDILVLPDVSTAERNWVLRHASIVLYPTSAEGFGFVPFEAAILGTPTVCVSFGPLREVGQVETMASNWDLETLTESADKLLKDPSFARRAVTGVLQSGTKFTWAHTAEKLVKGYFQLLQHGSR